MADYMKKTLLLLIAIIILPSGIYSQYEDSHLIKLRRIFDTALRNYVDTVDQNALEEAAIMGMLKELDPHSKYFPPKKMKDVNDNLRGNFEGIGIESATLDDTITIITTAMGGPSEAVGLQSGDKIITIDGDNAIGLGRKDISEKLKGRSGTNVILEIKRETSENIITVDITRAKIPINSIEHAFIIDGTDIGYISIKSFSAHTHNDFMDSIEVLKNKGMKKLIIDLHGNPGGYLNQAYEIADEFISEGQNIVFTRGRNTSFNKEYVSTDKGDFKDIPVICISDKNSASAAEILMGAIQDLDRGLIIGETSFGKGLVQRQYNNKEDGSGYRITTSRYYTPSGRCIQRSYEDEEKYKDYVGRIALDDGKNLQDWIEHLNEEMPEDSIPPLYDTKNGRKVPGGGGITPDYYVISDTMTQLTNDLKRKRTFFRYADHYINMDVNNFRQKYEHDFLTFLRNFEISEEMLSEFKKFAERLGIHWNPDEYKTDLKYIKTFIKTELTRRYWDSNEYMQVSLPLFRQVEKALELFPEAEKLAELN